MVHHNPLKDNLVIKRDRNGSIVRDVTTGVPVQVQKMMLMCNPRVLHIHMIEHFDDATEGNRVLISKTNIRELLKTSCSHIKKMSAREKICVDVRIASYLMTCTSVSICIGNDISKE
jgi:hypothetical protein